jgi:hypothetical protein
MNLELYKSISEEDLRMGNFYDHFDEQIKRTIAEYDSKIEEIIENHMMYCRADCCSKDGYLIGYRKGCSTIVFYKGIAIGVVDLTPLFYA